METKGIVKVAKNLGGVISKNSPTILTVCAVGGLVTTAIFAVKATPKALLLLEEEQKERWEERYEHEDGWRPNDLTALDVVRITWKYYIPAGAIGLASIACIIGANHISLRRNAALASVYTITEAAFKEYQAKVAETIGRNKELKVRDEISGDRIKKNPPGSNEVIFTGKGEVLCYDSLSGRYFKSNIEHIRRSVNELNKQFLTDMWMSVNDLYYALGLAGTKLGDEIGWDLDKGLLEIQFNTQLTVDDEPCLVLNYDIMPKFI